MLSTKMRLSKIFSFNLFFQTGHVYLLLVINSYCDTYFYETGILNTEVKMIIPCQKIPLWKNRKADCFFQHASTKMAVNYFISFQSALA